MAAVDNNPVVIIRGATGCGKTTQVPQYILDRFMKGGRASDCNIIVTQVMFPSAVGEKKKLNLSQTCSIPNKTWTTVAQEIKRAPNPPLP